MIKILLQTDSISSLIKDLVNVQIKSVQDVFCISFGVGCTKLTRKLFNSVDEVQNHVHAQNFLVQLIYGKVFGLLSLYTKQTNITMFLARDTNQSNFVQSLSKVMMLADAL